MVEPTASCPADGDGVEAFSVGGEDPAYAPGLYALFGVERRLNVSVVLKDGELPIGPGKLVVNFECSVERQRERLFDEDVFAGL